ncbi:hypothetical protein PanWU01x14_076370 [Parasponia andersonii]|uniref:Uncharacterized protein n=1 Tax=Parasponia andersonii TaxID=3476 RepID=A0A2P5DCB9_PARAD|nr:hypothetical protein PanWU01x14_076370 [Parasponia andersonii]
MSPLPNDPNVQKVHAGLALSLAGLYFVTKLLEGYSQSVEYSVVDSQVVSFGLLCYLEARSREKVPFDRKFGFLTTVGGIKGIQQNILKKI